MNATRSLYEFNLCYQQTIKQIKLNQEILMKAGVTDAQMSGKNKHVINRSRLVSDEYYVERDEPKRNP